MLQNKKTEIKPIIEYVNFKGYSTIDITKLMNRDTYSKYTKLSEKHPNVVLYFERVETNNLIYEILGAAKKSNYCFFNKGKFLIIGIEQPYDVINNVHKRCIDNFFDKSGSFECMICFENNIAFGQMGGSCEYCLFRLCYKCLNKMLLQRINELNDNPNNVHLNCPQCRQDLKVEYSFHNSINPINIYEPSLKF